MLKPIIYFVLLATTTEGVTHEIDTPDGDCFSSGHDKDAYVYYTQLITHGIFPTEKKTIAFQVKACHDAFILLSSAPDLNSTDFYEVVLGGASNRRIVLRRKYGHGHGKAYKHCFGCLSCNSFTNFTVKWSQSTIVIMKDSTIYVNWTDPNPLPVNGIGIATGCGSDGSWVFEESKEDMCPCHCEDKNNYWSTQNFQNYSRTDLEKILEPKLQKIKQELSLNKYNLSLNIRKRTSAPDNRKSSKQIGIVGIAFLAFVIGLLVLIDITSVGREMQRLCQILQQKSMTRN